MMAKIHIFHRPKGKWTAVLPVHGKRRLFYGRSWPEIFEQWRQAVESA